MANAAVTFYRGVVVDNISRILKSPNIPNRRLSELMNQPGNHSLPGLFFTTGIDGPTKATYLDALNNNGIPVLLKFQVSKESFPLLTGRLERPVNTDGVEFDFKPITNFNEMADTIAVNLGGLSENQLKALGVEISVGDTGKPLEEAYGEFKPYSEFKKEQEERLHEEGRISGEGGVFS